MNKTNAMRIIERDGAEYTVHTYDGGALSGVAVAEELGEDVSKVYKTLVTTSGPGKFFVFVIPVAEELDLKKAAKAAGEKSVEMVSEAFLQNQPDPFFLKGEKGPGFFFFAGRQ